MEKLPAYKKCYNKLKSDIDNNVYPIGSYLPTEDELGKIVSVAVRRSGMPLTFWLKTNA